MPKTSMTRRESEEADVFRYSDKVRPKGEKRVGKVIKLHMCGDKPYVVEFEDGSRKQFSRFGLEHADENKRKKPIRFPIGEIVFDSYSGHGIIRKEKMDDEKQFFPIYVIQRIDVDDDGSFSSSFKSQKANVLRKATDERKRKFIKDVEIANRFCDIDLVIEKEELAEIIKNIKGKIDPKVVEEFQKIYDSERIVI